MEALEDDRGGDAAAGDGASSIIGEAATLNETSSGVAITFAFALLVVLLVLAAQFESFISAVIIMFTVPFGLAAAVLRHAR